MNLVSDCDSSWMKRPTDMRGSTSLVDIGEVRLCKNPLMDLDLGLGALATGGWRGSELHVKLEAT